MRTPILAICSNKECRSTFFTDDAFSVPPGATLYVGEMKAGVCSKCGSAGTVAGGRYFNSGKRIHYFGSIRDFEVFLNAASLVKEAMKNNTPVEEFRKLASERAPEFSALWNLMPSSQQEACAFWTLVLAALGTFMLACQTFRPSPEPVVPQEIIDAILSARPGIHDDSHKEPSTRPDKDKQPQKE